MLRLIIFAFVLLIMLPANAQLTNGLVAHWDFNGNTNDISGNGLNGTPFNILYTSGKSGNPNTAVSLNGTNSYISAPFQNVLNVNTFSICAVVKVNGFYSGLCQTNAILWRGTQFTNGYYSLIYFDNPFDSNCNIFSPTQEVFAGQVNNLTSGPNTPQWYYTPTIVTQRWYCVITTFDGTHSKIYVDGVLMSTHTVVPGVVGSSNEGLTIGKTYTNPTFPYWMNGTIDDLRIYNRALTQLEVDSFCNLFPSSPPPVIPQDVSIAQPISKTTFCPGDNFILHYTVTAPFNPGNMFTAQLSDAAGGFANPVNIGSVTATGAGTINCTIPANTPAGTGYRVRVAASDPLKTSVDNGVNLTVSEFPQIIVDNRNIVTCVDDTLSFSVRVSPPGTTVTWYGPMGFNYTGNNATIPKITPDHTGNYTITANNNGCVTSDSINITIGDPYFILGNDTTLCESKTLELQALSLPGSAYLWQDGSTGPTFTVREKGLYYVRATNTCGSFGSNIQVDYIPCECNPVMPTAFTPNNDGLNDAIGPILNCFPAEYKFIIANRWGNIVFETDDYQKKWDGRHVSVPAQLGTYFYYIQITDKLGNKTMHKGDILLLR